MKQFVGLRAKFSFTQYDGDDCSEDKKAKDIKKFYHKKAPTFEDSENSLEEAQVENKINHLERNNIGVDSLTDFMKKNKIDQ